MREQIKRSLPNCAKNPIVKGQRRAIGIVADHVRLGFIKKASEYKCVDCGKQAEHYDHRDYNKPLDIEPVCQRCNFNRGPAIPSKIKYSVPTHRQYLRRDEVIEYFGGIEEAARKIGVKPVTIATWPTFIPNCRNDQLYRLSNGKLQPKNNEYGEGYSVFKMIIIRKCSECPNYDADPDYLSSEFWGKNICLYKKMQVNGKPFILDNDIDECVNDNCKLKNVF